MPRLLASVALVVALAGCDSSSSPSVLPEGLGGAWAGVSSSEVVTYGVSDTGYRYEIERDQATYERGRFATVGSPEPGDFFGIQFFPTAAEYPDRTFRAENARIVGDDVLEVIGEDGETREYRRRP